MKKLIIEIPLTKDGEVDYAIRATLKEDEVAIEQRNFVLDYGLWSPELFRVDVNGMLGWIYRSWNCAESPKSEKKS